MIRCLLANGRGGSFLTGREANNLIMEGSARRIDAATIQLKPHDDIPTTHDESCRMGPNVTECFADGMEWARELHAGWKPIRGFGPVAQH